MKKLLIQTVLVGAFGSALISCSSPMGSMASAPMYNIDASSKGVSQPRNIVKSGSLSMHVAEIKPAVAKVEQVVANSGGYLVKLNTEEVSDEEASLKVKVPAAKLEWAMTELEHLGKVRSKRVWLKDQTQEMILASARLELLQVRRKRINALIAKATKVSDKIELEKLLAEIESELFEMESAKRILVGKEQLSDLSIDLSRKEIRGPIGALFDGFSWSLGKLFTLRD